MIRKILSNPLLDRYRLSFIILLHAAFAAGSIWVSFLIRFEFTLGGANHTHHFIHSLPIVIILSLIISGFFNLYQGIWRYVSIDDLKQIIKAAAVSTFIFAFIITSSKQYGYFTGYPRSVFLLNFLIIVLFNGGTRFAIRIFRESFAPMSEDAINVLIIGAGRAGNQIAKTLKSAKKKEYIPVGFIDNDKKLIGNRIQGIKILGNLSSIKKHIIKNSIREIFIAIPEATNKVVEDIMNASKIPDWDINFKIAPSVLDIMSGKLQVTQIRDVSIDDLLSRPNIQLDDTHIRSHLENKTILITGAGGSIGSEMCYQVASYKPKKMLLLDMGEENAYHIDKEIKKRHPEIQFVTLVGSIRDKAWVEGILSQHRPHHIYHAAAYKHVHLMEWNPFTCINNNVFGTAALADAAVKYGAEKFVMISTDKAVNPKGIMGISKRIAERVVLERPKGEKTLFNVVRFGNVLGSSGSVIPLFQKQIREGGPVTVTDPEATRYFMSIPEAVQLVLQAATLSNTHCIYLLEMGNPIKIIDLAHSLIELSGLKVNDDIEVIFTGMRDGEKLYEELLTANEDLLKTPFDKIRIQKPQEMNPDEVSRGIQNLREAVKSVDKEKLLNLVNTLVPESCLDI